MKPLRDPADPTGPVELTDAQLDQVAGGGDELDRDKKRPNVHGPGSAPWPLPPPVGNVPDGGAAGGVV
jgi:hypothetical protein